MNTLPLLLGALLCCCGSAFGGTPASQAPTRPLYPLPLKYTIHSGEEWKLDPCSLAFRIVVPDGADEARALLQRAVDRYLPRFFWLEDAFASCPARGLEPKVASAGAAAVVDIVASSGSMALGVDTDDSYLLSVAPLETRARIEASTVFGALRGLETLSQLVLYHVTPRETAYALPRASIEDRPRFRMRVLAVDTGKNYLAPETLKRTIDAMSFVKMNVLRWRVSDAASVPFDAPSLPRLKLGAFTPSLVYTPAVIRDIVVFARDRGVWVLPEFDSPAFARAFKAGYPEAVTECPSSARGTGVPFFNPARNVSYAVLESLLRDAAAAFVAPESQASLHIGGSAHRLDCWQASEEVRKWMQEHGITSWDRVENLWHEHAVRFAQKAAKGPAVVQQHVFDTARRLQRGPDSTLAPQELPPTAQQGAASPSPIDWSNVIVDVLGEARNPSAIDRVTKTGVRAIWSGNYGLDRDRNWGFADFYTRAYDLQLPGPPQQQARVIGVQATQFSVALDDVSFESETWPRAAGLAERAWSPHDDERFSRAEILQRRAAWGAWGFVESSWNLAQLYEDVYPRALAIRCLLARRGIRAGALSPGNVCVHGQSYMPPANPAEHVVVQ